MLNRTVSLVVCLSVIAGAAFAQTSSNQGTGYIFEFANSAASPGQFQGFIYNTTALGTPVFNATGPTGSTPQVIAKPDGSKFYVVNTTGIDDFNPGFTTSVAINGISGNITQAIITPDGRYLLVAASSSGANTVYVLSTTTDGIVLTQPANGSVIGIVASRDSTRAWVLEAASQAYIATLNLSLLQQVGSPAILFNPITGDNLIGGASSITLSPFGLLYVTGSNNVVEIIPSSLQTALPSFVSIPVLGTPGPLQFSTDGTMAYFINETAGTNGQSLGSISLPSHAVASWPPYTTGQSLTQFDSIFIAAATSTGSPTRLFAHSATNSMLWDVAPDFSTVAPSALNSVLPATTVLSIAESNEIPSARYLYTLTGGGSEASLYRIDLTTNTVTGQASASLGVGTLQFSIVPPETNPAGFLQLNASQTLTAGATAAPLIARVLDATGRPMFAVPVTFTDPSGTLTFSGVSATTNEDGYAQATVTLGAAPGSFPVTLTAGSGTATVSTTFALIVPGSTTGGGGTGPSGINQVVIIGGNGQLYQAYESRSYNGVPMTVQVNDTNGNPLPNVAVTFTVTGNAIGAVDNPNATTCAGTAATSTTPAVSTCTDYAGQTVGVGQAAANFLPEGPPENTAFQSTTITAVATDQSGTVLGSVTFEATIFQNNSDNTGGPQANITPVEGSLITAGEGDVVPNAIVAQIFSGASGGGPIPNVGIRISQAPPNTIPNGPGTCQGMPLTDVTGTVTCNFVASCSAGLGIAGFSISLGEFLVEGPFLVNIVPGSTRTLALSSGNNQTGRPSAALTLPLTVNVTDQCGTPASGAVVTWKVVSGSATLSTTSTASNAAGKASVNVTLGGAAGTVQIVASLNAGTSVTFTETVQAVVGSLVLVSGNGQSALQNTAFAAPLVFQLSDASNNPISGLSVTFALASGSATISPTSATTNSKGQVSVTVTAGNVAGPVVITATYSTFTVSANLTVTGIGPTVTVSSFVNAASGQPGLTPCGLGLVTGSGLAPGVTGISYGANPSEPAFPWPTNLNGVSITINGSPAPLQAVSNQGGIQQVNFQTPCETVPGSPATVVVQVGPVSTQILGVSVLPAQPGIFTYGASSAGTPYALVTDASGNAITPTNPAQPGQTYYMYATGLGQTSPPASTNSVGTGETIPNSNIILAINNTGVPVNSVQYQADARGVYVISFNIPASFTSGTNLPISLGVTVNAQTFNDGSQVALPALQ
jgi:uncharacterized protein (TIGR03437 family)